MPKELPADTAATEYASIADLDAAAEARGLSAWDGLGDEQKTAASVAMMLDLETLDYIGERASDDQELEWPRTGTDYSDDAWPWRLVQAFIEGTFALGAKLAADPTADPLSAASAQPETNIKRDKTGPLEIEYFAPVVKAPDMATLDRFPAIVQNLLRPLIRVAVVANYGSGKAVRVS